MTEDSVGLVQVAINRGVRVVSQIADTTGLPKEVVSSCVEYLHSEGTVVVAPLSSRCHGQSCVGCSLSSVMCMTQPRQSAP